MGTGLPIILRLQMKDKHVILELIIVVGTTVVGSGRTVIVPAGLVALQDDRFDWLILATDHSSSSSSSLEPEGEEKYTVQTIESAEAATADAAHSRNSLCRGGV